MSSTTEVDTSPDIVFRGTDGNECEAFVVAIRDLAFAKGMDEDYRWMLRLATTRLRGKALRWHARLEPSIEQDWDLFVQALFDQYPSMEEPAGPGISAPVWSTTTFSPSLSAIPLPPNPEPNPIYTRQTSGFHPDPHAYTGRRYDTSSEERQIGLLRIVTEKETGIPQNIWWDYAVRELTNHTVNETYRYPKMTTLNRHEALIVCFLPSSAPHRIGCLLKNSKGNLKPLSLFARISRPERTSISGDGSVHLGVLNLGSCRYNTIYGYSNTYPVGSSVTLKSGDGSSVWNLLADGTLQASLSSLIQVCSQYYEGNHDETKFTTTEVHVDTSGAIIRFVKPGTPLEQDKNQSCFNHSFVLAGSALASKQ